MRRLHCASELTIAEKVCLMYVAFASTTSANVSVHDGWGLSDNEKGNAIYHGNTQHMDAIRDKHNFAELEASGLAVGLKEGLMGNSEVG